MIETAKPFTYRKSISNSSKLKLLNNDFSMSLKE
jgi:hypothetical protein